MKIIDSRSGLFLNVGQTLSYHGGESLTLLQVRPGILSAKALVRLVHKDYTRPGDPLTTTESWTPLIVRYMHPHFRWQRVAFVPS